jgi:alginate O-acetyltransferase complex protein AlgI
MVFSSSIFLLYFLPLLLIIYHLVPRMMKNYVLLAASILFYSWGAPKFIFVILGSTILDFYIVKMLYLSKKILHKRIYLAMSITMNLGLLAFFKYANFFVENVNALLLSMGFTEVGWTSIALPIGISFYTFQTLTYSIDVYRRVHKPLNKLTDYLLYIMSFPQMIAGPIVRFNLVADQITNRKENIDDKLHGFYRFIIGLAKKILVANVMAEQADLILNGDFTNLSTANAWIGILAYTFQIYFDFSGYSDMAIGLGKMFGFKFPENFNSPYVSQSISEFWRRWHMTLGGFMRDYLYIPLGGSRVKSPYRLYFNLWLVFLLSGLWHGASWNFVVWGAFHGFFLILDRLFLLNLLKKIGKVPAILFTFFITIIGWVIFRIEEMDRMMMFFKKMFSFEQTQELNLVPAFTMMLGVAVFFSFFISVDKGKQIEQFVFHKEKYSLKQHYVLFTIVTLLLILSASSLISSDFNPFIYFRF